MAHYLARPIERLVPLAFTALVVLALSVAWLHRDEGHLTPESGVGYWLGITGAVMMALLMVYPLRKRVRWLARLGSVPAWFRVHMVLGVLGPTLVVIHSNFKLGSLNSNVALSVMLVVVASGVAGRFLYVKVHKGLYGSRADVGQIVSDAQALKASLGIDVDGAEHLIGALRQFESNALTPRRGFLGAIGSFLWSRLEARRVHADLARQAAIAVRSSAQRHAWTRRERRRRNRNVQRTLALYFAAVRKASRFAVYERLLALWHVLHLPLFILLVLSVTIHVVAVHLY